MGCSIPSILQIRLFSAIALSIQTRLADLSHLSPLHLLRHKFGASFGQIFGRTLDEPLHMAAGGVGITQANRTQNRSEEHTSELQSLMRTSYAVFCLKKKKK